MRTIAVQWILMGIVVLGTGCSSGPEPIAFGQDQCAFCRMTIAEPIFGAELITDKGRVLKYDAAECLIDHLAADAPPHKQLLAIAYDDPRQLYPVDSLTFVIAPEYRSPMGANLAGFRSVEKAKSGEMMNWEEVRKKLADR